MPWVRLHATKDYLDMVECLSAFPKIHQTFNLVPSLLDQIEEYLPPQNKTDTFLELSRKKADSLSPQERRFILEWFFLANPERMIKPYPRYHDLLAKRGMHLQESDWPAVLKRFKTQDYLDIQVWFNLVWIDPWLRSQNPELIKLEQKADHFTEQDKELVLDSQLSIMGKVIPAYQKALQQDQVELTTSPYYHPILPLLYEPRVALAALPDISLPEQSFRHPEDARWQLEKSLARHQQAFGRPAKGIWPSEGSVSEAVIQLAIELGISWLATDEAILWRTLKQPRNLSDLYKPHLLKRGQGQTRLVFRDRELSDLVGFVYSQWPAQAAVDNFMRRLGEVHRQFKSAQKPALISVVLDGENAWEFYENDGRDFLTGLYQALSNDGRFRCVTVSEYLKEYASDDEPSLPELFSGSWIDANFATWIGHPEKNKAWVFLEQTRQALNDLPKEKPEIQEAWKSLGAAEGSDWMWWFGDTHFTAQAAEFDALFRAHLSNSYLLAGLKPPAVLDEPIRAPAGTELHQPTGVIHPVIDGRETSYYEWLYAGGIDLKQQYSAIQRSQQNLLRFFYGFDAGFFYLRIDPSFSMRTHAAGWSIEFLLSDKGSLSLVWDKAVLRLGSSAGADFSAAKCAMEQVIELSVPLACLGVRAGEPLQLALAFKEGEQIVERYPAQGFFRLLACLEDLEMHMWPV